MTQNAVGLALRSLVPAARLVYRATPFLRVRRVYYDAFARLVRGRVVRKELDGVTYELDLGETIDLTLFLGEFERDVHDAIVEFCRPGMVVADIGANIGAHALLLARQVAPTGRVYAFEPTDYAFRKLQRNVSLNPWANMRIERVALSESCQVESLVDFRSSWPTSGPRKDGPCRVSFETFDQWCARNQVDRVDLVKLDVDSFEWSVLQGARVFEAMRPLFILEVTLVHYRNDRNPVRLLLDRGYRLENARTRKRYGSPEDIVPDLQNGVESVNLICRPE